MRTSRRARTWRRRRQLLVPALLAATVWAQFASPEVAQAHVETATICFVPSGDPHGEGTQAVARTSVPATLNASLSYAGPCASYGQSASIGDGTITAYSQSIGSVPLSIGVIFTSTVLDGLPMSPASDGRYCYDKNGDGTIAPNTECSGGYMHVLKLSAAFRSRVRTPFQYTMVDWNPMGHVPSGVWTVPHFDVHFYMENNAERASIRTGPCDVLVNCDDYKKATDPLPAAKYIAPDYQNLGAVEPAMGNHLIDKTVPEFNGKPFTHTFLYGAYNAHITFYEPMTTYVWYTGLRNGTIAGECFPFKLPHAWEKAGWYPTQYCLRYRPNRRELTTSLEKFVYRVAG